MIKVIATSEWHDMVWVADHKLRKAQQDGEGIKIIYKGKKMTIPVQEIHPQYWTKGDGQYQDKRTGKLYHLWGIPFVEDKNIQSGLF